MASAPESIVGPSPGPDAVPFEERFEILREIGRGSQKRIELARDHRLGKDVAIARIPRSSLSGSDRETFEALYLSDRLGNHPHIVPCEEVFERGNDYLVVSPYLPGGSLEQMLEAESGQPVSTSRIIEICRDICQALAHAHGRGIVHADVKPANILFDAEGTAYLADFGLAQIEPSPTTELRGTPAYLAPELILGEAPSAASDLYAIGCIFYEVLAGEPPFRGETVADLLRLHQIGRPADLRRLPKQLPLQLVLLIEQLLAKDPAERPARAWDVMSSLWGMSRARAAFARGVPDADDTGHVIGRVREEACLSDRLDAARQGRPSLTLIRGQGGSGKTRLLHNVIHRAAEQGFMVLYGAASRDRPLPCGPVVDALVQLSSHISKLEPQAAEQLRDFLYITLEEEGMGDMDTRPGVRDQYYALLLSCLKWASARNPIMFVLEDLQYADSATLDILGYLDLALQIHDESEPFALTIVGTFRPGSAPDRLQEIAASIEGKERNTLLELPPFGEPGCHAFLCALGIERPDRRLIEDAHRFSHGNPLILREFVRQLRVRGALEQHDGMTRTRVPLDELDLPSTMSDWMSERLEGFDPVAANILAGCALVGTDLDRRIFDEQVRSFGLDPDVLIREAITARLLKLEHGRLDFYHPLTRSTLARRLDPRMSEHVHLVIAKLWQRALHRDSRIRDLETAKHLIGAGSLADPELVVDGAIRAARQAARRFGWSEASFFLNAALERTTEPLERADLHHEIAEYQFHQLNTESCFEHYGRAVEILRTEADRTRFLTVLGEYVRTRVWLGESWPEGRVPEIEELRRGLDAMGNEDPALRLRTLTALFEYEFRLGDSEQATRLGTEAAAQSASLGESELRAPILSTLGTAAHHALRIREALEIWREGIEQGQKAHDSETVASCAQKARSACFRTGDFEATEALNELLDGLGHARQIPGRSAVTNGIRAHIALARGDLDSAEASAQGAIELLRRVRYPWAVMIVVPALAATRAVAGDLVGAHQAVDLLLDPVISSTDFRRVQALARTCRQLSMLVVGEPPHVPAQDREHLGNYLSRSKPTDRTLIAACYAAELAGSSQDHGLGAAARPILEEAASSGWVFTLSWPCFVPRLLGVTATLEDDLELADHSFVSALEWTERLALPVERGRTLLDHAHMLALRNAPGDPERAADMADEARLALAPFSKSSFAARAEKLSAYLHARI